jgi:dipeptidyl aminopeptidase/acylaminoacyl peptidase
MTPEVVAFPSGSLTLHGFLYRPSGAGPFPAIVFNHGSEKLPGPMGGQAQFYVPHGFVLFVPHRRGQGRSADAGTYIGSIPPSSPAHVEEIVKQSDDVIAAVTYVASLAYVDPKRVAVVGCSYGGVESLLAAERGSGITSAIDFAGGAMMWASSPALQQRMKTAARAARVPVFFIQAQNDFDTAPSIALSDEMKKSGKPTRVHIFPPNGTSAMDGHHFCAGGPNPPWGAEVLQFLSETSVR